MPKLGKRIRLKIGRSKELEGSSPSSGTMKMPNCFDNKIKIKQVDLDKDIIKKLNKKPILPCRATFPNSGREGYGWTLQVLDKATDCWKYKIVGMCNWALTIRHLKAQIQSEPKLLNTPVR